MKQMERARQLRKHLVANRKDATLPAQDETERETIQTLEPNGKPYFLKYRKTLAPDSSTSIKLIS